MEVEQQPCNLRGRSKDHHGPMNHVSPSPGMKFASEAFTFLVPAMLTLAKVGHSTGPTQHVHPVALPKMPLVDVPVVDHRTAATWWKSCGGMVVVAFVGVLFLVGLTSLASVWLGKYWNIED